MLGASEYANIKTKNYIKVGQEREPVAEYTSFRWVIIAGGKKRIRNCLMLTRSVEADHAELCSLDVLGLKEDSNIDNDIYQQFKDQLRRNEERSYLLVMKYYHSELVMKNLFHVNFIKWLRQHICWA